jgi:hypothetical protein
MDYTGNVSITTSHLQLPLILGFAVYMYGMCLAHGILQTVVRHHPFSSKATRTGPFALLLYSQGYAIKNVDIKFSAHDAFLD